MFWFLMTKTPMGDRKPQPPPPAFEGLITGKEWVPAHSSTQFITVTHHDGTFSMIPITSSYKDAWLLYIGRRSKEVPKEVFDTVEIGKFWKEQ